MRGKLIFLEGLDGCGKGTQSKRIGDYLKAKNKKFILTREPGGTEFNVKLRELLMYGEHQPSPLAEAILFAADRADHYEKKIIPCLRKGCHVISDRNWPSTLAYQNAGRGVKKEAIDQLIKIATLGVKPDLVLVLDIPIFNINDRLNKRGEKLTHFDKEKEYFQKKVRQAYLKNAKKFHWQVIDAMKSENQVFSEIKKRLDKII